MRDGDGETLNEAALVSAANLGYRPQDFKTALLEPNAADSIWLLSFWTDAAYALYRHRTLGYRVPFAMMGNADHRADARLLDLEALEEVKRQPQRHFIAHMFTALKNDFEFEGAISRADFQRNLVAILSRAPLSTRIFIIEANEYLTEADGSRLVMPHTVRLNEWTREVAARYPSVDLLNIRDFVRTEQEVHSPFHFDRLVYYRAFQCIERELSERGAAQRAAEPRLRAQTGSSAAPGN